MTTPTARDVLLLANTLKGAGLSCLFVLSVLREPMSIKELAAYTGYDRKSVSVAMDKLETLALAEKTPGDRWVCSENPNPVCSGYYLNKESIKTLNIFLKPPQQTNNTVGGGGISEHSHTDIPIDDIARLIQKLTAARCPKQTAEKAITTALHNKPLSDIEADIDNWLAYCQSEAGKSIKIPGAFVASKLRNGEVPPETTEGGAWYTQEEAELILR